VKWELPGFARKAINALPDLSDQSNQSQAFLGGVASLLFHVLLLALWTLSHEGWVGKLLIKLPRKEVPVEMVIQMAPPPPPPPRQVVALDQLPEKTRIDSEGLAKASTPVTDARFQSDRDLEAGSKNRPKGSTPLPQTNARRETADKSLVQKEARTGAMDAKARNSGVGRLGASAPESKVTAMAKKRAPAPQPAAVATAAADIEDLGGELVFRKVSSGMAAPVKVIERLGSGKKAQAVEDSPDELFQEGKQQSKVDGGLAENGKTGVNAVKTPVAAYMKQVSRAIGARWNQVIRSRMDSLETGSVKVRFKVGPDGVVREAVLEQNSANREFSELCLEVVRAVELEPPPPEAGPLLRNGLLEIPFTFSLY
jgi:TonB family protein